MRTLFTMAFVSFLVACQTTLNPLSEPLPELAMTIDETALGLSANSGARLSTDLTLASAVRFQNALRIEMVISQDLADQVRGTSRAALAEAVERDWRPNTCAVQEYRTIVEMGGRIETQFVDRFQRDLFNIAIVSC